MAKAEFPLIRVKSPYNTSWGSVPRLYPSNNSSGMAWSNPGDVTIQGKKWSGDTPITASGDPTSSSRASLGIMTGANNDANTLWSCSDTKATERQVRGVYFRTYTNQSRFRPRISGVALQYKSSNGQTSYCGLNYRTADYTRDHGGSLNYEGGDSLHDWWGIGSYGMPDGTPFHQDKKLSGVLFHMETTWKTGSAEWCYCYVYDLRFICDAGQGSNPVYNDKHRIWGFNVK
jgi:hypothetical protein